MLLSMLLQVARWRAVNDRTVRFRDVSGSKLIQVNCMASQEEAVNVD